ncbi:hypothetical protein HZH68_009622 [Vespula germanica]|uniref:Uncharacterized protein n=1 Tax=Vespula germanica TaxID=30212 RepID=A0A834JW96_VESGE|nr:hypothetical protein HZH68_009622 [Vespula germanica]
MLACTRARDGNAARAHRCQKASRAWKPFTNKADVALQEAGRTESSMKRRLPAVGRFEKDCMLLEHSALIADRFWQVSGRRNNDG